MAKAEYPQPAGKGWLVAGYIFALLGGLIGIAIGAYLWLGKIKDENGNQVPRFNEESRKQGMYIFALAIIMIVVLQVAF